MSLWQNKCFEIVFYFLFIVENFQGYRTQTKGKTDNFKGYTIIFQHYINWTVGLSFLPSLTAP